MNLTAMITDNITEILIKIVKFTRTRQKILVQNIINVNEPDFTPPAVPAPAGSPLGTNRKKTPETPAPDETKTDRGDIDGSKSTAPQPGGAEQGQPGEQPATPSEDASETKTP